MYRDNTLIPTEAVRLAALGALVEGDCRYAALASDVRYFVTHIAGPSLDLLGTSLELLQYEGLVETVETESDESSGEDHLLRITDAGREIFAELMLSNVRAPMNEVSNLVIALKIRFLHLLPQGAQAEQAETLVEMCETEVARLTELQKSHGGGHLGGWLDMELRRLDDRLAWFRKL
jgi:DNA-binding PadR family transcriptional regulator